MKLGIKKVIRIGNSGAFARCLHIPDMSFFSRCPVHQCNSKSNCRRGFCGQHRVVKLMGVVTLGIGNSCWSVFCYSCVTVFAWHHLISLGFLFAVKGGVVFQFSARSFISRCRHVELCASCFLVSEVQTSFCNWCRRGLTAQRTGKCSGERFVRMHMHVVEQLRSANWYL